MQFSPWSHKELKTAPASFYDSWGCASSPGPRPGSGRWCWGFDPREDLCRSSAGPHSPHSLSSRWLEEIQHPGSYNSVPAYLRCPYVSYGWSCGCSAFTVNTLRRFLKYQSHFNSCRENFNLRSQQFSQQWSGWSELDFWRNSIFHFLIFALGSHCTWLPLRGWRQRRHRPSCHAHYILIIIPTVKGHCTVWRKSSYRFHISDWILTALLTWPIP